MSTHAATLAAEYGEDGIRFSCQKHGERVEVDRWALESGIRSASDRPVRVGALLRLREDGIAEDGPDRSLDVAWAGIAALSAAELRALGLPAPARVSLEISASGALSDPDFSVSCGYIDSTGRRLVSVTRKGCLLSVSSGEMTLQEPLFGIVEDIEKLNNLGDGPLEAKFAAWGRIAERLPSDAVADGHLRKIRVTVASAFTLEPIVGADGEPDFDPFLVRIDQRENALEEVERSLTDALPAARQRDFAKRFRAFSELRSRYSAGAETFVLLTPEVQILLREVKRAQSGTPDERRRFLESPTTFLRAAADASGSSIELDDFFFDEGLSDRVQGVGIWAPKVVPWVQRPAEPWLPPEQLGVRVGDDLIQVEKDQVADLLDKLRKGAEEGTATITYGDREIPCTPQAIEAFEALIPVVNPADPNRDDQSKKPLERTDKALLIVDNLEVVAYAPHGDRSGSQPGRLPAVLETDLLAHQRECLLWLQEHWGAGSPGALLADDMGLGKTLEALSFLAWLREEMASGHVGQRPVLVVAPTGLLNNWLDEHDKHLYEPGLGTATTAYGTRLRELRATNAPRELDDTLPTLDLRILQRSDWVMTTYETLRDYQHSFARVRWAAAVFDEAQKIKNPAARLTDAALAMNVDFAITMTGTPVENRPADLWAIVDRAQPGRLGALKDFSKKYERDEEDMLQPLQELRTLLLKGTRPPLMLRRLKEDHLEGLPEKEVHYRPEVMPPRQAAEYRAVIEEARGEGTTLGALQKIRSVSLHPYAPGDTDADEYVADSARLKECFAILDEVHARGEKALVFIEFREMQDFLVQEIQQRYRLSEPVLVINGAVSGEKRKGRVDTFQKRHGFDAMLLSPRAGGVGLTLTAANHVIHLSRWWNPSVEDQCTDRSHRIGQEKTVHIYYPMARHPDYGDHSFDDRLDDLLTRKREVNRTVLAPAAPAAGDLENLYATTFEAAEEHTDSRAVPLDLDQIDLLEPLAFEDWVLRQLADGGYGVRRTPHQDVGADGLAFWRSDEQPHTLLIQCKHTQRGEPCDIGAVQEVLNALPAYVSSIEGLPVLLVVTNAAAFTRRAGKLAQERKVTLLSRTDLPSLRGFRPPSRAL
jgi:hypothetical protein